MKELILGLGPDSGPSPSIQQAQEGQGNALNLRPYGGAGEILSCFHPALFLCSPPPCPSVPFPALQSGPQLIPPRPLLTTLLSQTGLLGHEKWLRGIKMFSL